MVPKGANVKKVIQSRMLEGDGASKEEWRHGVQMSYQNIGGVYFMQKKAEMMSAGYAILECFTDRMRFL